MSANSAVKTDSAAQVKFLVQQLVSLKADAKGGLIKPESMEERCLLGVAWRRDITPTTLSSLVFPTGVATHAMCQFDRTVEAVFVLGCLLSDPKCPTISKPRIGDFIDRVDTPMMNTGRSPLLNEYVERTIGELSGDGYALLDIRNRLVELVLITRRMQFQDDGFKGTRCEIVNAINNVLSPFLSYTENLIEFERLSVPPRST